jgi:methylated-DNA-[protein]-cysteine S-methyltransferase
MNLQRHGDGRSRPLRVDSFTIQSPLGPMQAVFRGEVLTELNYTDSEEPPEPTDLRAKGLQSELKAYFAGEIQKFTVPLAPSGSRFQQRVWQTLQEIPYGCTRSYLDLAKELGDSALTRAVGRANATNPIAILIPCHRVIRSDGDLCGYAGGLWRKERLLLLEGSQMRLF